QRAVRRPRAAFSRKGEGLQSGLQGVGDLGNRFGTLDPDPDDVHPAQARERAGPADPDLEWAHAGGRLSDGGHDFGDEALLRLAEELDRQVHLGGVDDLEGWTRPAQVRRELIQRGTARHVDRDEPAKHHPSSLRWVSFSGTNVLLPRKVPRRYPSWIATCRTRIAASRGTRSSSARSWIRIASRPFAKDAACAKARSREASRREKARKNSPGTRSKTEHSAAAATPRTCWKAAPATARTTPTPDRPSVPAASNSYTTRLFNWPTA